MSTNYLAHHGVKGMHWGVRKAVKNAGHRTAAGVYGLNEKTYRKLGNNQMASMNASARKKALSKIDRTSADKALRNKSRLSERSKQALASAGTRAAINAAMGLTLRSLGKKQIAKGNVYTGKVLKAYGTGLIGGSALGMGVAGAAVYGYEQGSKKKR